ncbi:PilZ domain-containing protein [Gracilibacillus sp. D59]|uniref:PilZ domain-containing protein n=1 Tax=Gracilibacillus sp. D59 TaxID=3457434 RepID=UPI003FCEAB12
MQYKRNEAFRYTFHHTVSGELIYNDCNSQSITLIDISPKGMKFNSFEKLDLNSNICIKYKIFELILQVNGRIVWCKDYGDFYQYGASLDVSEDYKSTLISELKKLAKTKPQ